MSEKHTTITIGPVRVMYPHLWTPQGNEEKKKYGATFLLPKSDTENKAKIDEAMEKAIQAGIQNKWGGARPASPPVSIYDGDGLRPNGEPFGKEFNGCHVIKANSAHKPEIVNMALQPIIDESEIYSGVYVYAAITLYPYMSNGRKGIGLWLGPVLKYKDGEPLGGTIKAAGVFSDIIKENENVEQPPWEKQ
jgi:hypothetical protein